MFASIGPWTWALTKKSPAMNFFAEILAGKVSERRLEAAIKARGCWRKFRDSKLGFLSQAGGGQRRITSPAPSKIDPCWSSKKEVAALWPVVLSILVRLGCYRGKRNNYGILDYRLASTKITLDLLLRGPVMLESSFSKCPEGVSLLFMPCSSAHYLAMLWCL